MTDNLIMDSREHALLDKRQKIKTAAKRMIWVTFQREGIHRYPDAATDPSLATNNYFDVSFLATPHRHIFHFKVGIEVFHSNRDIEFIQFKRWLEALYQSTLELNHRSCEMIADELYEQIATRYPDRNIQITVSEDNENGCTIQYNTHQPINQLVG